MFSGLTNQISGWVANKPGQGEQPPVDPNAPNAQQQMDPNYVQNGAEGEIPVEGQPGAGGVGGRAAGFLGKAMAAKDGLKEKAAGFQPPALGNLGGGMLGNLTQMIPGQKREEEVPDPNMMQGQMQDPNMQGQMQDPNAMVDQNYYDPNQQYQQ